MAVGVHDRYMVILLAALCTAGDVCQPGHAAAAAAGQARCPRPGELQPSGDVDVCRPLAGITPSPGMMPFKCSTAHGTSAPAPPTLPQVWQRVAEGGPLAEKCSAPFRMQMMAKREGKPLGARSASCSQAPVLYDWQHQQ